MTNETIMIDAADDGSFSAYVSRPDSDKAPGLVLMQYICGVNAVMRRLADEFAEAGYLVIVPDLFWRQEPDVQLNNDPANPVPEQFKRAMELNDGFVDDDAMDDLNATLAVLRDDPRCSGRAGALGYCLGGRTAYLMATRSSSDCNVGYYGVNIDTYLGEQSNISTPLMLHIAGNDELCSVEAHDKIVETLSANEHVTLHEYDGVGHAFALDGGHNFNADASSLANNRSLEFLARNLELV